MAESDEELKSCLMQVKEESENVCLKINIHRCQLQKKKYEKYKHMEAKQHAYK